MELKFKEVSDKYKVLEDAELAKGIMIKPYLTIAELNTIVIDLKDKKTSIERHFSKIILLTDFCSNIDITGMKADEVYDIASELGLIETFQIYLSEYHTIDEIIKADESIYNVIKEISDNLTPQINEAMKKLGDGSGLMGKLKDVMSGGNK